jgi:hypothetical protein
MPHKQPIVFELNESHKSQVITTDINNPPPIPILEVIQRRKDLAQLIRRLERAIFQHAVTILNRDSRIWIPLGCIPKRFSRNDVHEPAIG